MAEPAQGRPRGSLTLELASTVTSIEEGYATLLTGDGESLRLENEAVFAMIGREAPLPFFRRSGVRISGELGLTGWLAFAAFLALCAAVYLWKNGALVPGNAFPADAAARLAGLGDGWAARVTDRKGLIGTLAISAQGRSFYYTLVYCALMIVFGWRRVRRRRTPCVTAQTATLIAVQVVPLFLLPEVILPGSATTAPLRAVGPRGSPTSCSPSTPRATPHGRPGATRAPTGTPTG